MSAQVIVALIAAIGGLGAALIAAIGVVLGLLYKRIARLEHRERATWLWARALQDLYYRYRRDGAPDPPPPPPFEGDTP